LAKLDLQTPAIWYIDYSLNRRCQEIPMTAQYNAREKKQRRKSKVRRQKELVKEAIAKANAKKS